MPLGGGDEWVVFVVVVVACAILSYQIAKNRGLREPSGWAFIGLVLGPLGVIAALVWSLPEPGPPVAQPSPGTGTLTGRLADLDTARAAGLLTDEEYAAKRRQIVESH